MALPRHLNSLLFVYSDRLLAESVEAITRENATCFQVLWNLGPRYTVLPLSPRINLSLRPLAIVSLTPTPLSTSSPLTSLFTAPRDFIAKYYTPRLLFLHLFFSARTECLENRTFGQNKIYLPFDRSRNNYPRNDWKFCLFFLFFSIVPLKIIEKNLVFG